MTPTTEQEEILTTARTSDISMMISAYAGTGKTTTLVMLAEALPQVPALALAFNVKIKKELEARFPPNFIVKTLNGLGHAAWTRRVGPVELDDKKLGRLVTRLAKESGIDLQEDSWTATRQLVSAAMNAGLVPSVFPVSGGFISDTPANWKDIALDLDIDLSLIDLAREVLIASVEEGHGVGGTKRIISYDDQIYLPTFFSGAFQTHPIVMVDEAQDLSPVQHEMIKRVCPKGRLIVVGDPKQAIYQFRGADSESMSKLRRLRPEWADLPLTLTFRCPRKIVERAQEHAPGYRAAETNPEGEIISLEEKEWSVDNIPKSGDVAVLCRLNAPLLSLALKLLSRQIGVVMLGRDIGKGLQTLAKKIISDPETTKDICIRLVENWRESESSLARANEKEHKIVGINDRADCLLAVLEHCKTAKELRATLRDLFDRTKGRITLASGHRSKGLEWDHVIHLDPFRIPSNFARKAFAEGNLAQLEQEFNLRYVIETRAKKTLILANLEDFV